MSFVFVQGGGNIASGVGPAPVSVRVSCDDQRAIEARGGRQSVALEVNGSKWHPENRSLLRQ
jgi:hypothetical protein